MARTSTTQATTQSATQTDTSGSSAEQTKFSKLQDTASAQSNSKAHLVSHPAVSEAAVMGKEDAVKGEVPVAFVSTPKRIHSHQMNSEQNSSNTSEHTIGPIATPDAIVIVNKLPKTRSGKIMRRLLKAVLVGAPIGDTSTLEDEGSIEDIKATYEEMRKQLDQIKQSFFFLYFFYYSRFLKL